MAIIARLPGDGWEHHKTSWYGPFRDKQQAAAKMRELFPEYEIPAQPPWWGVQFASLGNPNDKRFKANKEDPRHKHLQWLSTG